MSIYVHFFVSIVCQSLLISLSNAHCSFTDEASCTASSPCDWVPPCDWTESPSCDVSLSNGYCQCASGVEKDILFNIDASGTIGYTNWQTQRDFIGTVASQGISNSSRIGFFIFAGDVNESRVIQYWEEDELSNYVDGLHWTAGWTMTDEVLESSMAEFDRIDDTEREKIILLITDGNPCNVAICPYSVCGYASAIKANGMNIYVGCKLVAVFL